MSFMLYVTDLIRHLVNLLFIQRITMFTQIITMFTHYFKKCQPSLLTLTSLFSKRWHRLNEPYPWYVFYKNICRFSVGLVFVFVPRKLMLIDVRLRENKIYNKTFSFRSTVH